MGVSTTNEQSEKSVGLYNDSLKKASADQYLITSITGIWRYVF
jgi:hypothetical protein